MATSLKQKVKEEELEKEKDNLKRSTAILVKQNNELEVCV